MTTPQDTPEPETKSGVFRVRVAQMIGLTAVVALLLLLAPGTNRAPSSTTTPGPVVEVPGFLSDEPIAEAAEVILPSVVHIQTSDGVGSGVIYKSDGLIITAAHVVGDNESVLVRFADGTQVRGTVVGSVAEVDVAVVSVERTGLKPAIFSLVKPRVGQLAIAVGSPWGLASTVTAGIISAVDQTNCGAGPCAAMVQTDAAINPGNSGGALINRIGEVVGINVSIFSVTGANDGVGFAVPSTTVVAYADAIIAGEPLQSAYLGVRIAPATGGRAGASVVEVIPDSGAAAAGIRELDVIVAVAGVPILSDQDLQAQIRSHLAGSTVDLLILRDGEEIIVPVTLGVRPEDL